MTHRRLLAITLAVLFLSSGLTGCSGCNPSNKRIECIDPVNGQTITMADDLASTTPGIQIAVTCTVRGFEIGDPILLNVHDDVTGTGRDYTLPYDGTGTVEFSPVTLQGGTVDDPAGYTLIASGDDGDVESNAVTISAVAETVSCPEFEFFDPVDLEDWNQSDDANSDLSDGFQHDVVITTDAGDAESVSLYLNDALVGTGTVDSTRIEFENVTFPSGGGTMTLRIQTTEACFAEATVTIDDDSPTCSITAPMPTDPSGWINATFDTSTSAGMQADITISTEDDATVELFVDIALTEPATLTGTADASGNLTFSGVDLAEAAFGDLTLQVRCRDTAGNPGLSSLNSYGVDSILPTIAITEPTGGENYNDTDDVNTSRSGIQINVSVHTDQPSTSAELMVCSGIPDTPEGVPTTDTAGDATGEVSLGGTDSDVDICASITKVSGNTATAGPVTVTLDTELPQVQITDPTPGFEILISNDMDTGTAGAQWTVEVECDSIGGTVELFADSGSGAVSIASPIACVTDTGSSLGGMATFTLVTIPEGAITLTAEHIDLALNSNTSAGVAIEVDTEAPTLTFLSPSCPATFHASGSYYVDIRVSSSDSPVTLTVTDSGGSAVGSSPYTEATSFGGFADFTGIELAPGANSLQACATDDHAQTGCSSICTYTVQDLPFVNITNPTDGTLLGLSDDVDTGTAGLQVNVTVLSDVADGITISLEVNGTSVGSMPYSSGGITFTGITLPEGTAVTIYAEATDTRGTGSCTNTVTVDITPPSAVISDLAITVTDRRGGDIRLTWTAPSDGGSAVADYDIRCSSTNITSDTEFDAAPSFSFSGVPSSPGGGETQDVYDLAVGIGTTYYCAVKSMDAADNRSPISNVPSEAVAYLSTIIEGGSGTSDLFGINLAPTGDVNGDTVEDFIAGSNGDRAFLFFGTGSGSVPTTPNVTITGGSGTFFGAYVAGIGNFDGDTTGLQDIAIGAWGANGLKGAVHVFLGRTSWPGTMSSSSADLTFNMNDTTSTMDDNALLGVSVSPAGDFNGDGEDDFIVGAFGWNSNRGAAFIILGRDTFTSGTSIDIPGDRTTGFVGDFMIPGFVASGRFGVSASALGRVNGDARDDIVIGARDANTSGAAYFFIGRTDAGSGLTTISTANQTFSSPVTGASRYGFSTAGPGDVSGDGRPDLVVSAPWYNGGEGRIFVYYNNGAGSFNSSPNVTITNGSTAVAGDYLGFALGRGEGLGFYTDGDMDGSGSNDLVYFAYTYNKPGGGSSGRGFLDIGGGLSSGTSETSDLQFPFVGSDPGGILASGNLLGDVVEDDGYPDVCVGFYSFDSNRGALHIYY